jgi:endonuclease YncB( thermonuclease family)
MSRRGASGRRARRVPIPSASPGRPARAVLLTGALVFATLLAVGNSQAREFTSYARVNADGSLRVGSREVNLYGIYIPPTGQTCRTYFSPPVCGSRAALALEFRIQGFVHCEQKQLNRDRSLTAVCHVDRTRFSDGEDLAAYLVSRGWALALPEAPFEYHALEKIARQQFVGVWGFSVDAIRSGRRQGLSR